MHSYECPHCGREFQSQKKGRKYCSNKCSAANAPPRKANSGCFQRGQTSWNAGTNTSGMKGKKHKTETKEKMRIANSGENAPNWQGGKTEKNYRIRRSKRYANWRKQVFERDSHTCQLCSARSEKGKRVRLHADHIKQFAFHPELRFDVDNGRTLCVDCHKKTDTYGKGTCAGARTET